MAIYRTYECPHCTKCFDFLHHPNDEPPPSFCPLCGSDVSGRKKKKQATKVDRIRSPAKPIPSGGRPGVASQSADGLYRRMESASDQRMQEAADILGVDKSSLSDMKMTNMRDNLRPGDTSHHAPTPAASIMGGVANVDGVSVGQMSFQQNAQAVEYARSVSVGPEAATGKQFRDRLVSGHQMRANQIARAGQLNKK